MRARRWGACPSVSSLTHEARRLGSTVARLKLKGIDGGPHKRWSMWFNSTQRAEPYLDLTSHEPARDGGVPAREPGDRCCMAVVSSCREMLGSVPQRAQPPPSVASIELGTLEGLPVS